MLVTNSFFHDRTRAPQVALSPLSFMRQAVRAYPDRAAVSYGGNQRSWAEVYARCFAFAGGLVARGIGRGHTVAVLADNLPEMFEAHFAVPMSGAALCLLNPRLETSTLAELLSACVAKAIIVDPAYAPLLAEVRREMAASDLLVIDIEDASFGASVPAGDITFDGLMETASPDFSWTLPPEETDPITLTQGMTSRGMRVIVHDHRAAHGNTISLLRLWPMPQNCAVLGVMPLYRSSAWGLPWAIAAMSGTFVALRGTDPEDIAPILSQGQARHILAGTDTLWALSNMAPALSVRLDHNVQLLGAGWPVDPAAQARLINMGFEVQQATGTFEMGAPIVVQLSGSATAPAQGDARAARNAPVLVTVAPGPEDFMLADPITYHPLPADGVTQGQILVRSNGAMQGYLNDPYGTDAVFSGGWLTTDLRAVRLPDGTLALSPPSGAMIETQGEWVEVREIQTALESHPLVRAACVVARIDPSLGPAPCAFVELKQSGHLGRRQLMSHCHQQIARFKTPRTMIFGRLPVDTFGHVDEAVLRARAAAL